MESFTSISENLFESIKHINEYNQEYWSARELMPVLEYKQWRQFSDTIERAKKACEISGNSPSEHFANDRKTSPMPNEGWRKNDYISTTTANSRISFIIPLSKKAIY